MFATPFCSPQLYGSFKPVESRDVPTSSQPRFFPGYLSPFTSSVDKASNRVKPARFFVSFCRRHEGGPRSHWRFGVPKKIWDLPLLMIGDIPSGELSHSNGKSPFLMGKYTISTGPFSIAMLVHQRVFIPKWCVIRCYPLILNNVPHSRGPRLNRSTTKIHP